MCGFPNGTAANLPLTSECHGKVTVCPVCNASFPLVHTQTEIQVHVNRCLDLSLKGLEKEPLGIASGRPHPPVQQPPLRTVDSADATVTVSHSDVERTVYDQAPAYPSKARSVLPATRSSGTMPWKPRLGSRTPRTCPQYKWIPHTQFTVDAFRFGRIPGCTAYFLTHFHADHYGGLSANFDHGPIYCSQVTANLVLQQLRVDPQYVNPLPMNQPVPIANAQVTLLDANHCPGSALIYFEVNSNQPTDTSPTPPVTILHTGDFRACPTHSTHPAIRWPLDVVFLDTTYLDPSYTFPPQLQVISAVSSWCARIVSDVRFADQSFSNKGDSPARKQQTGSFLPAQLDRWLTNKPSSQCLPENPSSIPDVLPWNSTIPQTSGRRILFVIGTYSIGKERIFTSIAQAIGSKVYVEPYKRRLLECLCDSDLLAMLATQPSDAQVHVVPMNRLNRDILEAYLQLHRKQFTHLVAIKPTGWTFQSKSPRKRVTTTAAASSSSASGSQTTLITQFLTRTPGKVAPSDSALGGASKIPDTFFPKAPMSYTIDSIRPTMRTSNVLLLSVPYSEHSSFRELAAFLLSGQIKKVVPTVNVASANSRERMDKWLATWHEYKAKFGVQTIPTHNGDWQ
ncbi:repair protein PSO2 SNM1 [Dimargaris verticillata]|uniref:Repair protein PSO2 SNM1 n=1 Tax=Dimargaris verticillata TaxID=2761393 RepID=A0A9W8B3Z6_9FUNG|nr:repair protein PSO2 SNM1 [Dimargaris verticillata]